MSCMTQGKHRNLDRSSSTDDTSFHFLFYFIHFLIQKQNTKIKFSLNAVLPSIFLLTRLDRIHSPLISLPLPLFIFPVKTKTKKTISFLHHNKPTHQQNPASFLFFFYFFIFCNQLNNLIQFINKRKVFVIFVLYWLIKIRTCIKPIRIAEGSSQSLRASRFKLVCMFWT